ncbi:hypothetical protein QVD17_28767 [Tagetes erecta]|uniref:Uncharacterized protein n=1 Tax=Tagetes erecta TaxID=13708 RepID=A0AAD8KDY4_TARER|nr:hypothetical protein QVD17_28767 [Tagetes erecta]
MGVLVRSGRPVDSKDKCIFSTMKGFGIGKVIVEEFAPNEWLPVGLIDIWSIVLNYEEHLKDDGSPLVECDGTKSEDPHVVACKYVDVLWFLIGIRIRVY